MKIKSKLKNKFIPVNVPKIFNQEKINVKKCLDTGWISSEGKYVKKFEESFSKYNKRIFGVAVSSGTAALEIGMKSLNLKKGDEVIIPTFSIISTALCVIKLGLKPVLVDSNIYTWNMDSDQVIKKITKNKFNNIQIGLLGISFKPNTDDVRESPGIKLAKDLSRTKAKIKIYDPKGMENAKKELPESIEFCNDEYEVAENSNLLVIVTEWNQFKNLNLLKIRKLMKIPVILDLRNIYSKEIIKDGFKYYSIGNN